MPTVLPYHFEAETKRPPFPNNILKCIFLNENVKIAIKIWRTFVSKCPINNLSALAKIMAWCRRGDKPLSESTMDSLLDLHELKPTTKRTYLGIGINHINTDKYTRGRKFRYFVKVFVVTSIFNISRLSFAKTRGFMKVFLLNHFLHLIMTNARAMVFVH